MSRNPIYQALRTTGIMEKLAEKARRTGAHSGLYDKVRRERSALRSMWMRGVIGYDEYRDLDSRVWRTLHARLIRDFFARDALGGRRRATREIRRVCPPGTTVRDFKRGVVSHVA